MILVCALVGSTSCKMTAKESRSIHRVDDLLSCIEKVHLESELAQERVREALGALHQIVSPQFGGDPAADYGAFIQAIETSEEQAEALRSSFDPMRESAQAMFDQWTHDLTAFTNPELRQRSRDRLDKTRQRYQAILAALEPTQAEYEAYNLSMRDCALFLGHDFNSEAVEAIVPSVRSITKQAKDLDVRLEACKQAAGRVRRIEGAARADAARGSGADRGRAAAHRELRPPGRERPRARARRARARIFFWRLR